METSAANKAVGADVGKTKASLPKRTVMYKGNDQRVSANFGGISIEFTRGEPKEISGAMAESLLKQSAKFTADLNEKVTPGYPPKAAPKAEGK